MQLPGNNVNKCVYQGKSGTQVINNVGCKMYHSYRFSSFLYTHYHWWNIPESWCWKQGRYFMVMFINKIVYTFYSLYVYILETSEMQDFQSENQGWEASDTQNNCSRPLLAHNRLASLPFKERVLCWPFPGPASWSNSAPAHSQPGAARAAGRVTCSSCSSKSSFGFWSGSCYRHARYVCYQWIKRLTESKSIGVIR